MLPSSLGPNWWTRRLWDWVLWSDFPFAHNMLSGKILCSPCQKWKRPSGLLSAKGANTSIRVYTHMCEGTNNAEELQEVSGYLRRTTSGLILFLTQSLCGRWWILLTSWLNSHTNSGALHLLFVCSRVFYSTFVDSVTDWNRDKKATCVKRL